ncbi:MAG TPA: AAA family ATPase [Candidatus Polarisedimenticolia bacterium]|nr:AAA family ATPase [Candidatus Polarisedimenticolia bacterium]
MTFGSPSQIAAPFQRICIGLTGPNSSGKGEVARFLGENGFSLHSLSDVVREEATLRGLDHTRENLIRTGTSLREEFEAGVLAQRILPRLTSRSVVDSIRSPGEIQVLRTLPGFRLLGIDAPLELRFERSRRRGRAGDGETIEDFLRKERLEKATHGPGQQLDVCFSLADRIVQNDGSLEELRQRVKEILAEGGIPIP